MLSRLKALFTSSGKPAGPPPTDIKKRFELMGKTGQGSMSKVFRARDRKLGRLVCLKILDKAKTARFESRFIGLHRPTEGAICLGLHHRNVVQTYDHGISTDNEPFLVMELIDGLGLNYLIETGNTDLKGNRINYLIQSAEALDYVHSQGYLH